MSRSTISIKLLSFYFLQEYSLNRRVVSVGLADISLVDSLRKRTIWSTSKVRYKQKKNSRQKGNLATVRPYIKFENIKTLDGAKVSRGRINRRHKKEECAER